MRHPQTDDAALALNTRAWIPSETELRIGGELVTALRALDTAQIEQAQPVMPVHDTQPDRPWWTQRAWHLAAQARIADDILERWADRLPEGYMVGLVTDYGDTARAVDGLARRLQTAWETQPPGEPSGELRARFGESGAVTAATYKWEHAHVPEADTRRIEAAENRLMVGIRSTIIAALTGDVDF